MATCCRSAIFYSKESKRHSIRASIPATACARLSNFSMMLDKAFREEGCTELGLNVKALSGAKGTISNANGLSSTLVFCCGTLTPCCGAASLCCGVVSPCCGMLAPCCGMSYKRHSPLDVQHYCVLLLRLPPSDFYPFSHCNRPLYCAPLSQGGGSLRSTVGPLHQNLLHCNCKSKSKHKCIRKSCAYTQLLYM